MAVSEQIIERIGKLLALAGNNPNEHEAAAAASKAQALMQQYDLDASAVEGFKVDPRTAGIGESERRTLHKRGKPGSWKINLFEAVGKTSDCWAYTSASGYWDATGYLIGRKQDIELAHYVFDFLVRELERLQQEFGKERWTELAEYAKKWGMTTHEAEAEYKIMGKHPLRAKNSWIIGASEAVASNLFKAKGERDTGDNARALVVNKEEAIRDWYIQQHFGGKYKTWKEYSAAMELKRAALVAEPTKEGKEKRLTKRDIERMEASARKAQRHADAEYAKKWKNIDIRSYQQGQAAGAKIGVRPGVKGGDVN